MVSLAWVSHQGEDVVPIPGTTKIPHIDDNVASRDLALTAEELRTIGAAVPAERVAGDRYAGGSGVGTFKSNM